MTIREFIEAMRQRPFMDHKDVRIALSADEWGTGDYADWRQLFVTMERGYFIQETSALMAEKENCFINEPLAKVFEKPI